MEVETLLSSDFGELGFGKEFCNSCKTMGFKTIEDVCSISPKELVKKEGFTYSWLGQLAEYMDKKGIIYLLQK